MPHVRSVSVSMLVRRPLEFGRIGVSGTDVFGLQMLKLAMNIVPFTHFQKDFWCPSNFSNVFVLICRYVLISRKN